ncbi:hypothetical protein [Streptomyces sp. Ru62]|uniref:hypothetical protein n=1 Tax=Streptomyces sp. Ru62 TaxID=2080745 RepID=UPI0011B0DA56|nr:hypothetical protein [Streptomyces sp. Ru62]
MAIGTAPASSARIDESYVAFLRADEEFDAISARLEKKSRTGRILAGPSRAESTTVMAVASQL